MARIVLYALGLIGLAEIAAWILVLSGDGAGVAGVVIYSGLVVLPLLSVVAAVWLVFDAVRRFIRCRFTRTA
jgi:hypothetical protein